MRIGRMAHALVAGGLGLTLGCTLTADSMAPARSPLVAYLGTGADPQGDFDYLQGLLRKSAIPLPRDVVFRMFAAPGDTVAALERAVGEARRARAALIVAPTTRSARVAALGAGATPVVFASYEDPVAAGIVDAMQRRRAPVAGIFFGDRLDGKRLELLRDAYPAVRRVAVIGDQEWVRSEDGARRVAEEARRLGLEATPLLAESAEDVRRLLAAGADRYDAWYLPTTNVSVGSRQTVIETMRRIGRPCIYADTQPVTEGGLMAYAQDLSFIWPGLAELVARVLAGEDAGAIPIVRPQRFVLAVRTGPETGVPPPDLRVVRRADIVLR
jgi:putative ABC transport system substrate-binding protein